MDKSRRKLLKSAGLAALCAGVLQMNENPAQAAVPTSRRTPLSLPRNQLKADYDVVVVGSGYGGAIAAARLSPGRALCVLERGSEWLPGAFPDRVDTVLAQFRNAANPLGLFDYRAGSELDVLVGNGLGGTSLINANVVIAADRDVFAHARWPLAIQTDAANGAMAAFETRVKGMLAVERIGEQMELRKLWLHRSTTSNRASAGKLVQFKPLDIAVNLSGVADGMNAHGAWQSACAHCGDCVIGCQYGAKNSLDVNYLPLARRQGAEIFTGIEVEHIERAAEGRWRIHFIARTASGSSSSGTVAARSVVLAAGAMGSTEILLRSKAAGLPVSEALGTRFSANGDVLGFGYNTVVQSNTAGYGSGTPLAGVARVGPTITSAASYAAAAPSDRYLIEEGAIPSALNDALRLAMPTAAGLPGSFMEEHRIVTDLGGLRADGALNHSMLYLGIGHDSASGRLTLDGNGRARLIWPGFRNEAFVARTTAEMRKHAEAFGGKFVDSPRAHPIFGGAMTTVHPLGGCPMADTADNGVVDADCRVFDPSRGSRQPHPGLRVMDGSMIPTSLGANPLLTIAALAERATDRFI